MMNVSLHILKQASSVLASALILPSCQWIGNDQDPATLASAARDFDLVVGISAEHVSKSHRQSIVRVRGPFLYLSVTPHANSRFKAALAEIPIDSEATIAKIEDNGRILNVTLSDGGGVTFGYMQMLEEGRTYGGIIEEDQEPTQRS